MQNLKNYGHYMAIHDGKQTIDPPMLVVDNVFREKITESTEAKPRINWPRVLSVKMWSH